MSYRGVIIEESLVDMSVLKDVTILSTTVERTTPEHMSRVSEWTLHEVEIFDRKVDEVVKKISQALVAGQSWYADFKNDSRHYVIFRNKVFCIDRYSKEQYDEAKRYGISLGIPEYQVDFHPEVRKWER